MSIKLPPPDQKGSMSLEEAIARRRSVRHFTREPITQSQLSRILWATQGVTDSRSGGRAVPSAGATYPLEVFVVCGSGCLEGVSAGIYRYSPGEHSLTLHREGDLRPELAGAALGQGSVRQAPMSLIIGAVFGRTQTRYGDMTERYVHIEVGHAGQNIYLEATALGLATVAVGAFHDEQVSESLKLDRQIRPLYIMPVGKPGR